MIVPDVNILLHAYNLDSRLQREAGRWWEESLNGDRPIGLAWVTALGFLRIVTNRHVFTRPMPVTEATAIVRLWLKRPPVHWIHPGERHAEILFRLLEGLGTAANLTTDAHLAALAIEYRAEIASTDHDFARFPELRWFNPVVARSGGRRPTR